MNTNNFKRGDILGIGGRKGSFVVMQTIIGRRYRKIYGAYMKDIDKMFKTNVVKDGVFYTITLKSVLFPPIPLGSVDEKYMKQLTDFHVRFENHKKQIVNARFEQIKPNYDYNRYSTTITLANGETATYRDNVLVHFKNGNFVCNLGAKTGKLWNERGLVAVMPNQSRRRHAIYVAPKFLLSKESL